MRTKYHLHNRPIKIAFPISHPIFQYSGFRLVSTRILTNSIQIIIRIMTQQTSPRKTHLKKSSFDLSGNSEIKQQSELPYEEIEKKTFAKQEDNLQNLLDLSLDSIQKKRHQIKQYEKFLEDRIIVIDGPELVTEGVIKSYKLYHIKSRKKDQSHFQTSVSRRFNDFQYLQKQLVENYGGCIIPLLPQKNIWTNVNMEGQVEISNRAQGLQKYLINLFSHSKLRMSEQVKNFLFENETKFSQKKGEYFSRIKTQEKLKQMASNAYSYGKGLISKFITGAQKQQQLGQFAKPSIEDLKLMQYQREVTDLINVINVLRKVCENSVLEMKAIGKIIPESKESEFECNSILSQFEDLCKYILSCNQALTRRYLVRLQMDQISFELQSLQKKIKSNPRSAEVDALRNRLAKTTQKCQKWTSCLFEELHDSISVGKSMIQDFIISYSSKKEAFYDL